MPDWILWVVGAALLLAAGLIATLRSRRSHQQHELSSEVARARRAIALAEAARDGCGRTVHDAEVALDEATGLLSGVRDPLSAQRATSLAEQAESRWRAAAAENGDAR